MGESGGGDWDQFVHSEASIGQILSKTCIRRIDFAGCLPNRQPQVISSQIPIPDKQLSSMQNKHPVYHNRNALNQISHLYNCSLLPSVTAYPQLSSAENNSIALDTS